MKEPEQFKPMLKAEFLLRAEQHTSFSCGLFCEEMISLMFKTQKPSLTLQCHLTL